ncbi:sigma-70 family RNA polymerase sigma factor [Methylococcus sp. EFPC2]|uniref:sigma-70 family RNA polymerase sigma factor n=1 Tax=Methylococcus sp. EFPC2 TaxID=2812648 RepID=UPI0019670537|nr:sigma-70 family RNA polymerase sigma factor [Methylococcus sp. EFPC2]QSA96005.1 sigma-70 family RNA polymerase sigma factor [Methylococcus sp. EFPC2]
MESQDEGTTLADWFRAHRQELVSFLALRLRCRDTAGDLAQETYLRLYQYGEATIANPGAFAFRVAANLVVDHQRKQAVRARFETDELPVEEMECVPAGAATPEQILSHRERLDLLQEALAELPVDCRTAFYLNRVQGRSHADIARHLAISESMVARHLARAMRHCKQRLD